MTLELVKPTSLYVEGTLPDEDLEPWQSHDSQLCAVAPGVYEVVYRRAVYQYSGNYHSPNSNYAYTEEVAIGILVPTTALTSSRDPEVLKHTTRGYNLTMVPRKAELPCKGEYSINFVPTDKIAYYTSFLVAVRAIKKGSPTYEQVLACLTAQGTGATRTAIYAAGLLTQ